MAAPSLFRRLAVPLLLACLAAAAPTPAGAVDVIPAQQSGERIPDRTITAIVGDVDGDGVRELVRLGPLPDDATHVGVEVISADADGRLTRHGVAAVKRLAGVEEQLEGSAVPDERGMVAARINEPARLLIWRVRGADRVLVAAIGTLENPRACCLTLGEVGLDERGQTSITERAAIPESARDLWAADLDADGTDELVVTEPPTSSDPGVTPFYVLRWVGGRFVGIEGRLAVRPGTEVGGLVSLGDSDGRRGQEVGLLAEGGRPDVTTLNRISLAGNGSLSVEQARMPYSGRLLPIAASEGSRLLVGTPALGTSLLNWPAATSRIVVERQSRIFGSPVAVIGNGSAARLMHMFEIDVEQLNDQLALVQFTPASPAAVALSSRDVVSFVGLLPGGLGGSEAFVFGGWLMASLPPGSSADRAIVGRPIAAMAATTPIGTFGPRGILMGLAEGELDSTREGGQLQDPAGPRPGVGLTAPLTSTALSREDDDGRFEPALSGGVMASEPPGSRLLLTRDEVSARIVAPAGSRIVVSDNEGARAPTIVPASGTADVGLPVRETQTVVRLFVLTPSGHGYSATWIVRVADTPPTLEARAPPDSFGFSVPIRGQTDPGVSVTVDGQAASVAPDGSFVLDVGVGLIPREVEIRAADAVGNVATQRVSIVGPIDYRRLPWIPIVVALTVVAGAILYVRVPRPSPAPQRPNDDDAVLEEIE